MTIPSSLSPLQSVYRSVVVDEDVLAFLNEIELDNLDIVGRVWLNGISVLEWEGWISPSPSLLQSVYQLDVADNVGVILFSFVFFVCVLCWMIYSGVEVDCSKCGG